MRSWTHVLPSVALACTACVSMPLARSAETRPGPTIEITSSGTFAPSGVSRCLLSRPTFDCSALLLGVSAGMTFGWISDGKPAGRALGAGLTASGGSVLPYLDYYRQQRTGESARGLGARAAVSIDGWSEYQAYARFDRWLPSGRIVTWNPALVAWSGRKDSSTVGTFVGVSNAVGLLGPRGRHSAVPSLTLVVGRGDGEYRSRGSTRPFGPEWVVFGGIGMTFMLPARRRAQ